MAKLLKNSALAVAVLFAFTMAGLASTTRMPVPGTLNYVEGQVTLNDRALSAKSAGSAVLAQNQILDTQRGKAEVLLTPGVFLRLGDDSQLQMLSPDLTNTKVRLTKGSAMLEVDELFPQNNLAVAAGDTTTRIDQKGLYDFNADTAVVGVLQGKATVYENDSHVTLKKGHEVTFADAQPLKAQKSDSTALEASSLYSWSKLRSDYEAQANVNAANVVLAYGGWYGPGWYWSPYWDMYSFIPPFGMLYSPFGWGFYSPGLIIEGHGGFGRGIRAAAPAFRPAMRGTMPYAMGRGGFRRG